MHASVRCHRESGEKGSAQLLRLVDLDVDYAQGYVFSRAKPIETWLHEHVDLTPLLAAQAAQS